MNRFVWSLAFWATLVGIRPANLDAQQSKPDIKKRSPVFSGPQVGEKLAPFTIRGVFDDQAGKAFSPIKAAKGKPIVLVFVHEVTRPSIGLTRAVMNYAAKRSKDGLHAGVVFLTGDATATEALLKRARHALPKGVLIGISPDGREGPGAYGLNRKVTLTFLVARKDRVTANFALVQPSIEVDAVKIARAIVKAVGSGKVPTIEQLAGNRRYGRMRIRDRRLMALMLKLIRGKPDEKAAAAAIREIEQYLAKFPRARNDLGRFTRQFVRSPRFARLRLEKTRKQLKDWAAKYGPRREPSVVGGVDIRSLLGPVIRKTASKEEVDQAARRVEKVAAKNEAVRNRIGRIANRIIRAGVLKRYGTKTAQDYLRRWAQKYGPKAEMTKEKKGDRKEG